MHRRDFIKTSVVTAAATLAAPAAFAAPTATYGKRGCCFGMRDQSGLERVEALRPSWMYSWALERRPELSAEVDFTPMLWGDWGDVSRAKALADVAARHKSGEVRHLLAYNEPDQPKQSNLSVERVLEVWPEFMDVGVPLVSPGCVHPDKEWMTSFMDGADRRGYRVDAVAVHSYAGPNAEALVKRLESIHQRFGKPIWITEFAVGDWEAKSPQQNRHSPERIAAFMRELLPALDELPCVERYAWFSASPSSAPLGTSALFTDDNKLTPLGEVYRQSRQRG
ncbi:MAG: glycosyl hydrolase [Lacipirellulaceae bacterium]